MTNSPPSNGTGNSIPILFYAGEALGQKGQGAAVAILLLPTGKRTSVKQLLASATGTEASYRALLIGLQKARQLGIHNIEVKGHNEKVFNQVNGLEEIDQSPLRHLHREVMTVMKQFERVMVEWIPLDQNRPAYQTVQKCLATAARSPKVNGLPRPIAPEIVRLIKLGSQATAKDFQALQGKFDEFSQQSLSTLRRRIPVQVQDRLALEWNGDESQLAEMYRWYLRGLPPDFIVRKFQLEALAPGRQQKLPWEDQLLSQMTPPPGDFTAQKLTDVRDHLGHIEFVPPPPPPFFAPLEEGNLLTRQGFSPTEPGLVEPAMASTASDPFATDHGDSYQEGPSEAKDTVPTVDQVQQIVSMIMDLSLGEKTRLVKNLAQLPELSNQFLTAIADRLKPSGN
ncbi:reverse transcriptase-like protein [Synechocystis sp. CACIAM 05]|uniref:reverse transcriptase-like protein n=1 Tax=Synechocystis sp. CACIAM 05 TaxID=1933929 RepID=UPI00138E6B99|nr:reverse transcriptase-like protein [Synechocystis sp. CACIAM 05]QHU99225.1 ribonuclease HI [Synechocystis sp. CACIAM 05]